MDAESRFRFLCENLLTSKHFNAIIPFAGAPDSGNCESDTMKKKPVKSINMRRSGGMADASDSKSDVGDYVWVQVPSPA